MFVGSVLTTCNHLCGIKQLAGVGRRSFGLFFSRNCLRNVGATRFGLMPSMKIRRPVAVLKRKTDYAPLTCSWTKIETYGSENGFPSQHQRASSLRSGSGPLAASTTTSAMGSARLGAILVLALKSPGPCFPVTPGALKHFGARRCLFNNPPQQNSSHSSRASLCSVLLSVEHERKERQGCSSRCRKCSCRDGISEKCL